MERQSLVQTIEDRMTEEGLTIDVGLTADTVILSGSVETADERELAEEIAGQMAGARRIENQLDILGSVEEEAVEFAGDYQYLDDVAEPGEELEPPSPPDDAGGGEPEFAPTDPVMEAGTVVGGFANTSMDSLEIEQSALGGLGDEALADAVRRELREDAATTDLPIHVAVRNGIVHLRGRVQSLDDAYNAEEVAGRLNGVREVIEELDVLSD